MKEKNQKTKSATKSSQKKVVNSKKANVKKTNTMLVSPKNYLYAVLVFIGIVLVILYVLKWYQVKRDERLMTSYLISSNTIVSSVSDLDSLNQIMLEAPSSYFIYLGYTNDEEVYNLECNLKNVIDKYNLNDIFYYVDLTNLKGNNKNYLEEIAKKLNINEIKSLPAIIYVTDGKIEKTNILDGVKNTKFKVEDLEKLLEIYEFDIVN